MTETTTIQMTGTLDPRDGWTADRCPMAHALDVVRTRSAFLVLREAFYGATRFEEFAERTGLSEPVTATRLRELDRRRACSCVSPTRSPASAPAACTG